MNKIDKFLAKLEPSVYRLKKGDFRIIYEKKGEDIDIISVTRRSEKTYRDF